NDTRGDCLAALDDFSTGSSEKRREIGVFPLCETDSGAGYRPARVENHSLGAMIEGPIAADPPRPVRRQPSGGWRGATSGSASSSNPGGLLRAEHGDGIDATSRAVRAR